MLCLSRLTVLSALLAGIVAVASCAPTTSARDGADASRPAGAGEVETHRPVMVALLTPSSSPNPGAAQLGQALENAARLAVADLNDPLLELRVYDTGGEPGRAAAAARQAVAEGAELLLGPLFAESTRAVASTAAGSGLNVISFSTDSTHRRRPGLPLGLPAGDGGAARSRLCPGAGLRADRHALSRDRLRPAGAARRRDGAPAPAIVVRTSYPRTQRGHPAGRQRVRRARAADRRARAAARRRAARVCNTSPRCSAARGSAAPDSKFLGLGEWDTRCDARDAGARRAAGSPRPIRPRCAAFVERYRQRYGTVPPQLAVLGYDAVQIAGAAAGRGAADRLAGPVQPRRDHPAAGLPWRRRPDPLPARRARRARHGDPRGRAGVFRVVDPAPVGFGAGT